MKTQTIGGFTEDLGRMRVSPAMSNTGFMVSLLFATSARTKGAAGPEMGASRIAGGTVYETWAVRDSGLGTGT